MTFNEIKNLNPKNFETRNEEIWESINNLSLEEIEKLTEVFDDKEIHVSLWQAFNDKTANLLASIIDISKLTEYQKEKLMWFCDTFEEDSVQIIFDKINNSLPENS